MRINAICIEWIYLSIYDAAGLRPVHVDSFLFFFLVPSLSTWVFPGYTYERLDGSVRGEERYLAIQNFNETEDTFIFLLSTRAGENRRGVGMVNVFLLSIIMLCATNPPQLK